jgi:hypothetical protein
LGDSFNQQRKLWVPWLVFLVAVAVLFVVWFVTFSASAWNSTTNYIQLYLEYVVTRPIDAFFTVSTGPGGTVSWTFLPVYFFTALHVGLYFYQKDKNLEFTIVTKRYLVYLVFLALFAISFQNVSQHYDWYWNPVTDSQGYVDTWTHITSPWLLGALIMPFAFERYLGWDKKSKWSFIFFVLLIVALVWEIGETVDIQLRDSASYFNYPMDSLKDIIMGSVVGSLLSYVIYQHFVMFPKEKEQNLE